ncbi:MAG: aminotransferase class V-fold PLP-dependent enzyme [Pseudomonadota bacterium]
MIEGNMREQFLLDPETVFLNHGSFGACPIRVFERYQAWQRQLERQPVAFLDFERGYGRWLADARKVLAEEMGAHPDDIVGCINATQGLNVVAQSLPLQAGDEILTTDHEYAALEKTWEYVARQSGARVVLAELPLPLTDEEQIVQAMIAAMTDRTRVLFISHITSPTALLFPLHRLIGEARQRGILTVIDGAHAPGHIPVDLDALGADFYAGNCHKWMMAPKGAAFLHARKEHQQMLNPLIISHGWQVDRTAAGPFGGTAFVDAMEMQGTRDPSAWLTIPEALEFRRQYDWDAIAKACADLAQETAHRLSSLAGMELIASREFTAPQMVSVQLPVTNHEWLKNELHDRYKIEIPLVLWKGGVYLRLSVQCYNTRRDMDLLVDAVSDLLAHCEAA